MFTAIRKHNSFFVVLNFAFALSAFAQTTDTFSWSGGAGSDWVAEDPSNWNRLTFNISGERQFPRFGDTAIFSNSALVGGGGTAIILIEEDVVLTIDEFVSASSRINNLGTISFVSDDTNSLVHRLFIGQNVTLDGRGSIVLNGSGTGINGPLNGGRELTNVDNIIRGNGQLQTITLVNENLVLAEGGDLEFSGMNFRNSADGELQVASDGSLAFVNSGNNFISGGTLFGENGAKLKGVPDLRDLVIDGNFLLGESNSSFTASIRGAITNQGTLQFIFDDTSDFPQLDQAITLAADTTLDGGGTIILNGSQTGISSFRSLTNVDNIIRGNGLLQGLTFENSDGGTVVADVAGKTLSVSNGLNNSGTLAAENGGTLNVLRTTTNTGSINVGNFTCKNSVMDSATHPR